MDLDQDHLPFLNLLESRIVPGHSLITAQPPWRSASRIVPGFEGISVRRRENSAATGGGRIYLPCYRIAGSLSSGLVKIRRARRAPALLLQISARAAIRASVSALDFAPTVCAAAR
ncbi:MAG: hypothetical protein ACYDEB_11335 [Dehalococcoidia bacterium]